MTIINISKPGHVLDLTNFKNFVLNLETPKLIQRELNFIIDLTKQLQLYSFSQLLVFLFHKNIYQTFNLVDFNFLVLYDKLKRGSIAYFNFLSTIKLNNKIKISILAKDFLARQILNKSFNDLLLYLWFYLPINFRFSNDSFFTSLANYNTLTSVIKTESFEQLINLDYFTKLQWESPSFQFKNIFIMRLMSHFNVKI